MSPNKSCFDICFLSQDDECGWETDRNSNLPEDPLVKTSDLSGQALFKTSGKNPETQESRAV